MVLDHVFADAIGALRDAFERALLERRAFEERFQVDILLGDLTWETSYGLPGEGNPPRVRADVTLDWPTWSQTAYRAWLSGEAMTDPPEILVEVVLRIQNLAEPPDLGAVLGALPAQPPAMGGEPLERSGPTVEQLFDPHLQPAGAAVEVSFEGACRLEEEALAETSRLDADFGALGGWIAAALVRLGDLQLEYLPQTEEEQP